MNTKKESNLNIPVKMPKHLKTDTEKIAWLGSKIRAALLTIERANEMNAKAEEDIKSYEQLIKTVIVTRRENDGQI